MSYNFILIVRRPILELLQQPLFRRLILEKLDLNSVRKSLNRHIYFWQLRLHAFFRLIPHPHKKRSMQSGLDRVARENDETRLQPGDEAKVQCVWAVEYYTPSSIPKLKAQFKKLGIGKMTPFQRYEPLKWLSESRQTQGRGGWINMGEIKRKSDKRFFPNGTVGPLPGFAEYASLHLINLSPSVSALFVAFHPLPEHQTAPFDALNRDYGQHFHSLGRSYSNWGPRTLKQNAIDKIRQNVRVEVINWFKGNFPGSLSAGDRSRIPLCEMLLINAKDQASREIMDEFLGTDFQSQSYDSTNWPGMTFHWPLKLGERETFHSVLLADRSKINGLDTKTYGGTDEAYPAMVESGMDFFLCQWGMLSLVDHLQARLSNLRDAELGVGKGNAGRALKRLRQMTIESADVASIASDFANLAENPLHYDIAKFVEKSGPHRAKDFDLTEAIASTISKRSVSLGAQDTRLNSLAMQQGNLLAASANLSLQGSVWVFTAVALIATIISAVKPAEDLWASFFSSPASASMTDVRRFTKDTEPIETLRQSPSTNLCNDQKCPNRDTP